MSEYKNLKIDDVYTFYVASGYINCNAEADYAVSEILGVETQEELDNMTESEIRQDFEKCFDDFLDNQNHGWYKKE